MKERSRLLRKNQTEAETTFWNIVRKRQFYGFRFHRQYVLHSYILDFVCLKKLLVIEFDGQQHVDNKEYDEVRNNYLSAGGFTVLRFWNHELLQETDRVLLEIYQKLIGLPDLLRCSKRKAKF